MALTRDFTQAVLARMRADPTFRAALVSEGIKAIFSGDADAACATLRDDIEAAVGFRMLGAEISASSKGVMHVGAAEAGKKLGTLLDRVASGEEMLITRHGKPVARMVPAVPGFNRATARQAARGLLEASRGVSLGDVSTEDLVNDGRP